MARRTNNFVPVINCSGSDLYQRALKNAQRLEENVYLPDAMYERMKANDWPGDTEGRLLLGQVLLAKAINRQPSTLDRLLELWPQYINAAGYFGSIYPDTINEQQLSSHGWVLRGLCELHLWRKDEWSLAQVKGIVENLALPCIGHYQKYPVTSRSAKPAGDVSGHSINQEGRWILSTDTGCAFIFMDGVIQAYSILGGDALNALCEEMIARFLEIDVVGLGLQTHATLTGIRGLLRFAAIHPDRTDILDEAKRIFELYLDHGMTETFANHNWFGCPGWTEPCAIVDSMQVARQLWQVTGDIRYRDIWQLIRWNGMTHGQRANGGFGTDTCTGSLHSDIRQKNGSGHMLNIHGIEATQCCSMRGAEGLADAIMHQALEKDNGIYLPLLESCTVTDPHGHVLTVESGYPWGGRWTLQRNGKACKVHLAAPDWCTDWQIDGKPALAADGWLLCNLADNQSVSITCKITLVKQATLGKENMPGRHAWRHGPVILGLMRANRRESTGTPVKLTAKSWTLDGEPLVPISERWQLPMPKGNDAKGGFKDWAQQVLFQGEIKCV